MVSDLVLPPVSGLPLGVVLLAAPTLSDTDALVRRWLDWLDARGGEYELLVANDGPAAPSTLFHPRLRQWTSESPQGEGRVLSAALAQLSQPLLAYAPLSAEYRPEHLGALLDHKAPEGNQRELDLVHLISGYRAGMPMPFVPRWLGWGWRMFCTVAFNYPPTRLPGWLGMRRHLGWLVLRLVFAMRYHDPLCPVRVFRREMLARLPLQSRGPFVHVELLAKATFLGALFASEQVPLDVVPPRYRGDIGALAADLREVMNNPTFHTIQPEAVSG